MKALDERGDTGLAAAFLQGLQQRQLRFQRCADCHRAQSLARYACAHCGGDRLRWETACGAARLHAVTIVSRAPSDAFRPLVPYTLVIATLDEGPRLMAHGVAGARIDDRVVARYFEHDGRILVRFEPFAD